MAETSPPENPETPDTPGTPEPEDLVDAMFARVRATAKRRAGHVPDLHSPGRSAVPRRSKPKPRPTAGDAAAGSGTDTDATVIPGVRQLHELDKKDRRSVGKRTYGATGLDGRRARRPYEVPRFGAIVSREIAERGWAEDMARGWVMNHWEELVGEKIAQHTKVEMIKDQKVFITCDSTAWATNLKYMQTTILQSIADKIGPNQIVGLRIFGPKPPNWKKGRLHVKGRGPRDTYG